MKITSIRGDIRGPYVSLECQRCGTEFEGYCPSLAGLPLGRFACPQCQTVYEIETDEYMQALDKYLPVMDWDDWNMITEEASRVAETWYRVPVIADLLTHRGINLGEPTERCLVGLISTGLTYLWQENEGDESDEVAELRKKELWKRFKPYD
jgi:transcription elongation factor Elf1